jgi:hypothetical protein
MGYCPKVLKKADEHIYSLAHFLHHVLHRVNSGTGPVGMFRIFSLSLFS